MKLKCFRREGLISKDIAIREAAILPLEQKLTSFHETTLLNWGRAFMVMLLWSLSSLSYSAIQAHLASP